MSDTLEEKQALELKTYVATLPLLPGVYRMIDSEGHLLYVGKASQLRKRVSSYFQKSNLSPRIQIMVSHIAKIEVTITATEAEALLLENNLIKSLKPRYNILFRDDKTYPYIIITDDAYPRLAYYRGSPNKRNRNFGPYPNAGAAKEAIDFIQKIFQLRTCEESVFRNRARPCLLHQIHRCKAPCVNLVSIEEYSADIHHAIKLLQGKHEEVERDIRAAMDKAAEQYEYEKAAVLRDQLMVLRTVQQKQFMEGGSEADTDIVAVEALNGTVCVSLSMVRGGRHLGDRHYYPQNADSQDKAEALEAFLIQHYLNSSVPDLILINQEMQAEALEMALSDQAGHKVVIRSSVVGERKQWLDMASKNALLALRQRENMQAGQELRLSELRRVLDMPELSRIECFDISHTMGEATIASCVVYDNFSIRNSEYRRYNIKDIIPGDDYAAMEQALIKRYHKLYEGEGKRPDLILIDGGLGQLNVAVKAMQEMSLGDIALLGVAKGVERKPGKEQLLLPGVEKPLQLSPDSPALHLIQQIRDEAHRFAISGHRAKRGKKRTESVLEDIAGIGDRRRRNLLAHFGGLRGVQQASVVELSQVEGISQALAEKIFQQFHEQ